MEPTFLSIQASYKTIDIALMQGNTVLGRHYDQSKASASLIPTVDTLLAAHHVKLNDLAMIVVDQGPGAFTSLRVAIATVNGISFASNIKLMGVDGLDGLAAQTSRANKEAKIVVSLLNAYNNELYYGIYSNDAALTPLVPQGYKKIDLLLEEIKTLATGKSVVFNGNGVALAQQQITDLFGDQAIIANPLLEQASAESIGRLGYAKWLKGSSLCSKLEPLYLKIQNYAVRPQ